MFIEKINSPKDIKGISINELIILSSEIRDIMINRISKCGGHLGPNFGIVEMTIALHYVFNSPIDKIIFDVSHQSYVHKILTGRKDGYICEEYFSEISGFANPDESEHDFFKLGHTSTSISLASGLAKSRDLKGNRENIIAIIGDGALGGGEALEGLNFVSELKSNFIIVVNDNNMSIAENHGGIYENLKKLRESNGEYPCNLFKAMGLEYIYVDEGNNIEKLIEVFLKVKDISHPIVVHINTQKGKGYKLAEENKESWHNRRPFDIDTGDLKKSSKAVSYENINAEYLLAKIKNDPQVVVVVAGVPSCIGFTKEKREIAGRQFIDVGIAEEHAVALCSGIAKGGGKPIFATQSSFMQRTYDQLSQDLCLNNNPATILVNRASVYGDKDATHLGLYDIAMMSNIPNLVYLAPTCKEEYLAMLDWSINQNKYPVAIRIPYNGVICSKRQIDKDYSNLNKYKIEVTGEKIAIIALGDFFQIGEELLNKIYRELKINPTLINPRYITGIDEDLLENLKNNHDIVITLEDGIIDGGFGEKISSFYGTSDMKVKNYGIKKSFPDRYIVYELLRENGITDYKIVEDIKKMILN